MNRVSVRCWKVNNYGSGIDSPDRLFITYPEDNNGHNLIICKSCGQIYAVTIVKEVYIGPPLVEKLDKIRCVKCGDFMKCNFAYYPEMYYSDGNLVSFKRDNVIPDEKESLVIEFYGIYD